MGCVFGRQASAKPVGKSEHGGDAQTRVSNKADVSSGGGEVSEVRNGVSNNNNSSSNNEEERSSRPKGEKRRSSRPNPRLSNPPKHLHGEQVAAGWPSWLSAVAGEAINGWTPRRADTFEKLDKVCPFLLFVPSPCLFVLMIFGASSLIFCLVGEKM